MVDLNGEEYIPKSFVLEALSRKEEEMIELFKEALPEGEVSVCSKHKLVQPYCDICGRVYGHNSCLSQIKDRLKSKGIEL